ncbi:MAG: tetratricopeptide repeat protein, partial [Woeseiaceae bacterium]
VFVFVLAAGFLVAVVLAWAYQVVPETGSREYPGRSPAAPWINQGIDMGIIVALVIAVGLVAYRQFVDKPMFAPVEASLPPLDLPEPARNSVAVLRFANLGADARFSDGLAENLLHMLARIREVSVPSRSTTWSLSDDDLNLVELADQLRVRYVLEGSVQQQDDNIRVVAQLIDGLSGKHVWSENYDRPLTADNFFQTQDDIAAKVVEQIQVTLSDQSASRLDRHPTGNLTALRHYLGGRQYLRQPMSPETLQSAVTEFESAIASDAGYVEAHAGLCEAHLGWYVTNRDGDSFDRAERACLRAAELDASSSEVHTAMGSLHRYAGRYAEAELQLRKALEFSPRSAAVLEELGRSYQADNRLIEAEQAFREAIRAEPRSWSVYKSMGNFLFRTGRYDQAVPYYRQVIALEPADSAGYNNLAVTLFMLGRFDDANLLWTRVINDAPTRLTYVNYANSLYYSKDYQHSVAMYRKAIDMDPSDHRAWRSMGASLLQLDPQSAAAREAYEKAIALALDNLRVNPGDQEALSQIAVSYARLGRHELARDALRRLRDIGWENPNMSYFVALAHHLLGEDDTAIRELERAVIMGFPRPLISGDPDFQTLGNNERYVALVTTGTVLPGT